MLLIETVEPENFDADGIWYFISKHIGFEWLDADLAEYLNYEYYLNYSGQKTITSLFKYILEHNYPNTWCTEYMSHVIISKFKDKWNRLYTSFVESTYNPVHNYDMTESETIDNSATVDSRNNEKIFGYNSSSGKDSSSNTANSSSNQKNTRELYRSGNIGVTTSQKMLTDEIKLRQWNIYEEMMKDVDSILCLQIY